MVDSINYRVQDRRELDEASQSAIGHIAERSTPSSLTPTCQMRWQRSAAVTASPKLCPARYVYRGKAHYGVVDSINYPNGMSFQRYQYPSQLPSAVKTRLREASVTVISAMTRRPSTSSTSTTKTPIRSHCWRLIRGSRSHTGICTSRSMADPITRSGSSSPRHGIICATSRTARTLRAGRRRMLLRALKPLKLSRS